MTYLHQGVVAFIRRHLVPVKVIVQADEGTASECAASQPPVIVVGNGEGGTHYRVDGLASPDDFLAQLSLGLGRYQFDRREFAEAICHFDEIIDRLEGTRAAAQALFRHGVARFKQAGEPVSLRSNGAIIVSEDSVNT